MFLAKDHCLGLSFHDMHIIFFQGKGLFAKKNINKGDVIFEETPIVSTQFLWNELYKYKACEYCMKSLETAEEQARRLSTNPHLSLPHPECDITDQSPYVDCPGCQVTKLFKDYMD